MQKSGENKAKALNVLERKVDYALRPIEKQQNFKKIAEAQKRKTNNPPPLFDLEAMQKKMKLPHETIIEHSSDSDSSGSSSSNKGPPDSSSNSCDYTPLDLQTPPPIIQGPTMAERLVMQEFNFDEVAKGNNSS